MKSLALATYFAFTAIATDALCADLKPIGSNCDLTSPPTSSGELVDGGFFQIGRAHV